MLSLVRFPHAQVRSCAESHPRGLPEKFFTQKFCTHALSHGSHKGSHPGIGPLKKFLAEKFDKTSVAQYAQTMTDYESGIYTDRHGNVWRAWSDGLFLMLSDNSAKPEDYEPFQRWIPDTSYPVRGWKK